MATVDIVLPGYPLRTARGSIGYSSCTLVSTDEGAKVLVDCASYADRVQLFEALQRRGLRPDDIHILILTHLHFDHCINARFFTSARVLVSKAEYEFADWAVRQTPYGDPYVIDDPDGLLNCLKAETVDAEISLAPDLRLLFTPGHTPGTMSAIAETPTGRVAIASDAAKSISELITGQVYPSAVCDQEQASRSIDRLLASVDAIIPGHDRQVRVVEGRPRLDDVRNRPALTLHIY
ncbi:MAG: MBL fold metallo-hydrolase [Candidatus Methylomirabilia bacterium]